MEKAKRRRYRIRKCKEFVGGSGGTPYVWAVIVLTKKNFTNNSGGDGGRSKFKGRVVAHRHRRATVISE